MAAPSASTASTSSSASSSPPMAAADGAHRPLKPYMLSHGPSISRDASHRRSEDSVLAVASRLLRAPNPSVALNARNRDGDTLLHACAKAGYTACIERLLREGAPHVDIDAQTEGGFTALTYASRSGHLDIVVKLVAAGADPSSFYHADAGRFFPPTADRKHQVMEAVRVGRAAYAMQLQSTLLYSVEAPWSRMPEVLVDMIVDMIVAEERPPPARRSAGRSRSTAPTGAAHHEEAAASAPVEQPAEAAAASSVAAVVNSIVPLDE